MTSTKIELTSVAIQDMQKLPVETHYYTDGSKSDSRTAAAFIVNKTVSCLRLNDDATITQDERMRKLKVKKKCVLIVKTRLEIGLNIGALIVR